MEVVHRYFVIIIFFPNYIVSVFRNREVWFEERLVRNTEHKQIFFFLIVFSVMTSSLLL